MVVMLRRRHPPVSSSFAFILRSDRMTNGPRRCEANAKTRRQGRRTVKVGEECVVVGILFVE